MNRGMVLTQHQIFGPVALRYGEGIWIDKLHPIRNMVLYPITRTIGDTVNELEWRGYRMELPMAPNR